MIAVERPVGVTIFKCVTSLGERHPTLPQRPPRTPPAERRPSQEERTRDGRESACARGGRGGARARGDGGRPRARRRGAPARERTRARRWRGSPARRRRGRPRVRRRARGGGGLTCVGARRRCLEWQDGRVAKGRPSVRGGGRRGARGGGRGDAAGRTRENESVERGGRRTDELRARPRRSAWRPTPPPHVRAFPQTSSIPRFSGR